MTTLIRTIELDCDLIEIHYNPNLVKRPYLVRVFNYNNTDLNEFRLDEKEFNKMSELNVGKELIQRLKSFNENIE